MSEPTEAIMGSIQFDKIADIPAAAAGYSLVTCAVANDGSLLFLFAGSSPIGSGDDGRGTHYHLKTVTSGQPPRRTDLPKLDLGFPQVDVFPDGNILLADSRVASDDDLNGVVYDPSSGLLSRMRLGDGISHAQVDALGRIWVAYFDEGIFGDPLSSAGLVCFSKSGEKLWGYPIDEVARIDDCYALNVSGTEAAIFFYTEFPLCRITSDFNRSYWKTGLQGCHAFAISERQALLSRQYKEPPDVGYLGSLEAGHLGNVQQVRLLLPDGSGVPRGRLTGRGKQLTRFGNQAVYRANLD